VAVRQLVGVAIRPPWRPVVAELKRIVTVVRAQKEAPVPRAK
jgi:hypothetical protein